LNVLVIIHSLFFFLNLMLFQANASEGHDHDLARELLRKGEIASVESMLSHALELHPGKLIYVELEEKESGYRYEFEILGNDGIVWEVYFDAKTGQMLKQVKGKE